MRGAKYFEAGGTVQIAFDKAPRAVKLAMSNFMEGRIGESELIEIFKAQGLDPKIIPDFIRAMRTQANMTAYNMDMGVPPMEKAIPTKSIVSPRGGSTGVRTPQALKRK